MTAKLAQGFGFGGIIEHTVPEEHRHLVTSKIGNFPTGSDAFWMKEAFVEAMKNVGLPNPNPSVGCVLVKDGKEISRGATEVYKQRHGERVAFGKLSDLSVLEGATAYVTLEPCSHVGNQPPCVELLVQSPVKRVVIARTDPNPLVAGRGIRRLQEAGKEVSVGLLAAECTAWNYPFFTQQVLKKPLIAAKWAQSLDGHLADDSNGWRWITGPTARSYTHWLRQRYDAILIGAGTLFNDFPLLNVRDCALPHNTSPLKIILDPRGKVFQCSLDVQKKLAEKTFVPPQKIVVITEKEIFTRANATWKESLLNQPHVFPLTFENNQPILEALEELLCGKELSEFLGRPLQSVLVEGGPRLISRLWEANRIDLAHVFMAPFLLGGHQNKIASPDPDAAHWTGTGKPFPHLLQNAERFALCASAQLGDDLLLEMIPKGHANALFETTKI